MAKSLKLKKVSRVMKKEWKNWEDQVDAFKKLGEGLNKASKNKVNPLPPPEE